MNLLVPGRHHLATAFQASYLFRFAEAGMDGEVDTKGDPLEGRVDRVLFAVTSADHGSTRRNPLPYALRALALHEMGRELGIDLRVYPIPEAGARPDFASYVLKTILHESEGELDLAPTNTVVACSTAVARLYEEAGFRVWAAERASSALAAGAPPLPWEIVEGIARSEDWRKDPRIIQAIHPASYRLIDQYGLDRKIRRIFSDPLLGGDGDLTATRDYGSYVRQMDENLADKWRETADFIRPGRIGDIGCAVGSWIRQASRDPRFTNSDFYGIEITRSLFDICEQRRHNGEFGTPNVWFAQRNAVEGGVFRPGSMSTIHSSSLTHEIESYAGREALLAFIRNRFGELESGGVWINRDVIGPEEGDREVVLSLSRSDGANPEPAEWERRRAELDGDRRALSAWLAGLSTAARFPVFSRDFRRAEGGTIPFRALPDAPGGDGFARFSLALRDASEYLLTKDYCDNWQSEMHETFCHWAFSDWKRELEAAGFSLSPLSRAWTNPWILEKRWLGRARLSLSGGAPLPWPPTNVILIAEKG